MLLLSVSALFLLIMRADKVYFGIYVAEFHAVHSINHISTMFTICLFVILVMTVPVSDYCMSFSFKTNDNALNFVEQRSRLE